MECSPQAMPAHAREDREGRQRGDGAGERDGGDARADDVRCVAAQGGRGPGLWGEVERRHVEDRVEDLEWVVSLCYGDAYTRVRGGGLAGFGSRVIIRPWRS